MEFSKSLVIAFCFKLILSSSRVLSHIHMQYKVLIEFKSKSLLPLCFQRTRPHIFTHFLFHTTCPLSLMAWHSSSSSVSLFLSSPFLSITGYFNKIVTFSVSSLLFSRANVCSPYYYYHQECVLGGNTDFFERKRNPSSDLSEASWSGVCLQDSWLFFSGLIAWS